MEKSEGWSCSICCVQFSSNKEERKPMILQCGHTFCKTCISGFPAKCPKCREEFVPNQCRPNYTLLDLLGDMQKLNLTESTLQKPVQPQKAEERKNAHPEPPKQKYWISKEELDEYEKTIQQPPFESFVHFEFREAEMFAKKIDLSVDVARKFWKMCEDGLPETEGDLVCIAGSSKRLCFVHLCHLAKFGLPVPEQLSENMLAPEYRPRRFHEVRNKQCGLYLVAAD